MPIAFHETDMKSSSFVYKFMDWNLPTHICWYVLDTQCILDQ